MQLKDVKNQLRIIEIINDKVGSFKQSHVLKRQDWQLIEVKRLPAHYAMTCESAKFNGKACGRRIQNVMVIRNKKGQILNVGTTCYEQIMGATDKTRPSIDDFNTFRSDRILLRDCKDVLQSQLVDIEKSLPKMIAAGNQVGLKTSENDIKQLIQNQEIDKAINELLRIQTAYSKALKQKQAEYDAAPTYVKRFKDDIEKCRASILKKQRATTPKILEFDLNLYNQLKTEGFTLSVIKEVFKIYNKNLPSGVNPTMARKNPW